MTQEQEQVNLPIRLMMLSTGEEIITEVIGEKEGVVRIQNPLIVITDPEEGHALVRRWSILTDNDTYNINKNHIMSSTSSIKPKYLNYYKSQILGVPVIENEMEESSEGFGNGEAVEVMKAMMEKQTKPVH